MSGAHRSAEAHGEATMNENGAFVARFCKSGGDLQNRPTFTKEEFPMSGAHRSAEAHGEATMNENGAFVARFCKSGGDLQNRPTFTKEK